MIMTSLRAGLLLVLAATPSAAQRAHNPDSARIFTEDIPRFWQAFDARARLGTARALDSLYLKPGTAGLHDFVRKRLKDAPTLAATVDASARYYSSARPSTLRVAEFEPQIRASFQKLEALYPDAVFPDVYFVVGRLNTGGTPAGSGMLIGAEMYGRTDESSLAGLGDWLHQVLRPVDDLPGIVAHELVHYQQSRSSFTMVRRALMRLQSPLSPSLLAKSLNEGSADYIGEMISGMNINSHVHVWAVPRERELWKEFQRKMLGTDLSGWFSGGDVRARPADLGYFIGYRIAQSYYEHATDKRRAIRDILRMSDPEDFLNRSRYAERFADGGQRGLHTPNRR
jgi:hypothetical protein